MLEYFRLTELKKSIFDEDGEPTGYNLFELKIPENYPKVLRGIFLSIGDKKYKYVAIPILNKPQVYYIKPMHVGGNVYFVDEINALKLYAKSKDDVDEFMFYDIDLKSKDGNFETSTKFDILSYLGFVQIEDKFILGRYISESGITKFQPLFKNRKKIIPPQFKSKTDKINMNSWILTVLYSLDYWFINERSRKYITSYGIGVRFKDAINKLIELGYLFKNNGKIYDVYTLFNIFDFSYSGFTHDCFDLGSSLSQEKINELFKKYQINFEEKREDFAKLYSNVISYYISERFDELLENPNDSKSRILRFLGLDYKAQ